MRDELIAEAIQRLGFEFVLVRGRLAIRNQSHDGTTVLHPMERPKDIDRELWRHICDELPTIKATMLRSEFIEVARGLAVEDGQPMPWEVSPNMAGLSLLDKDNVAGIAPFDGSPSLWRAMIGQVMARQSKPRTRAAIVVILAPRQSWPTIRTSIGSVLNGHVHMDGHGHGQPSPDALATVYDTPPQDEDARSRFWTDVRGDSRRPAPIPIVLAGPHEWLAWESWLLSCRRPRSARSKEARPDTLPSMWAYHVTDDLIPQSSVVSRVVWSAAVADPASFAVRTPDPMPPNMGSAGRLRNSVSKYRYGHPDEFEAVGDPLRPPYRPTAKAWTPD